MLDEHIWLVSGTLIHRSQRCRITSSPLFWRLMSFLSGVSGAAWVRERPGLPHNGSSEEALWHWHQQPTEESGNVRRTFVKPFQMFTPHLDLILELHLPWFIIWITNGLIFFLMHLDLLFVMHDVILMGMRLSCAKPAPERFEVAANQPQTLFKNHVVWRIIEFGKHCKLFEMLSTSHPESFAPSCKNRQL